MTGHGYAKNELIIWKYPSFDRACEVTGIMDLFFDQLSVFKLIKYFLPCRAGHSERILDLCQSPDGSVVVSTSADETIRLWTMFPIDPEKKKKLEKEKIKSSNVGPLARQCLR